MFTALLVLIIKCPSVIENCEEKICLDLIIHSRLIIYYWFRVINCCSSLIIVSDDIYEGWFMLPDRA